MTVALLAGAMVALYGVSAVFGSIAVGVIAVAFYTTFKEAKL